MDNDASPFGVVREPEDGKVRLAFDKESVVLPVGSIIALKKLRDGLEDSKKYAQIICSIKAVGIVEAPVVIPNPGNEGSYFLLDGHLRIEALKALGVETVECLVATDEETFTYNKRINRLPPIQEHRMIVRAVERGVSPSEIGAALGLEAQSIKKRFRLLDGICDEAAEILKAANCSLKVFDMLRRMVPARQVEAADLMTGQNNFSAVFAQALLLATPAEQLSKRSYKRKAKAGETAPSSEHMARMERELVTLQTQLRSVEDNYGIDNLHLTLARGYLAKLLGNANIARWLNANRPEYLAEFRRVTDIETLGASFGISVEPN